MAKPSRKYRVAVVGATGVVGKEIIAILESRKFPVSELVPLASARSAGSEVVFHGESVEVLALSERSFDGVDIALFSAGGSVSAQFCPIAVAAGAVCIDNTSHFRMDPSVPLVVPEVNAAAIKMNKGIIANPNCSTAQLVVALKPIYDAVGIERIVISTYQSVSGAGKAGLDELEQQTRANLRGVDAPPEKFAHHIAFNLIPQIDVFTENGYTKEEMKMVNEIKKIMGDERIRITATAVRVPVFVSHSESVNLQTQRPISAQQVRELLQSAKGVQVLDDPALSQYPTPRRVAGEDDVFVGRIRQDISQDNGIEFWCVGDNLRKGAALNAVQIAEAWAE